MTATLFRNLYMIFDGAWRRRYSALVPMLILPCIGLIVGLLSPRTYETRMSFLVQESAKLNPFLTDLSVATNLESRMEALNTLLHSRHVLLEVVNQLKLVGDGAGEEETEAEIERLSEALNVSLVGSDLVKITYRDRVPDGMKELLTLVGNRFIHILLAPEQSSLDASEGFLESQLEERRRELDAAEGRLAEFKSSHINELPQLHQGNVQQLRETSTSLEQRRIELAGARAALSGTQARLAKTNPVIGRLEEQIVSLRAELALMRARYTDEHSEIQGLLRKLARVEAERQRYLSDAPTISDQDLERLWNLANWVGVGDSDGSKQPLLVSQLQELESANSKVQQLEQETRSLTQSVATLGESVQSFGGIERDLQELERDIKVRRKLYEDLLERREKARISGALGRFEMPERIKLIDQPHKPLRPVNPGLLLFVLGGLVGGVLLGCGLAVLQELGDTTIRYRHQLESVTGFPVLARVPAFDTNPHHPEERGA